MNRLGLLIARWRLGIQLELPELALVARLLGGRRMLVFGLGHDSVLWHDLNRGGRTSFLESDRAWFERIRHRHARLEAHLVSYGTVRGQWRALLERPDALALELPPQVRDAAWDLALIDGPPGWHDLAPGRMKAIYTASRLVAPGGDVLVHDAERPIESAYCARFLGRDNLVARVRGRAVLEHYRVPVR